MPDPDNSKFEANENDTVTLVGFGVTENGSQASNLLEVDLRVSSTYFLNVFSIFKCNKLLL